MSKGSIWAAALAAGMVDCVFRPGRFVDIWCASSLNEDYLNSTSYSPQSPFHCSQQYRRIYNQELIRPPQQWTVIFMTSLA